MIENIIVLLMGLPGVLAALALVSHIGSKRLNTIGFWILAVNFLALGIAFAVGASPATKFSLLCVVSFSINFGPNVGTYVLPAIAFPRHLRTTCHGISCFGGKCGALFGTMMFPIISKSSLN